jgi:NADPH-dependent 2,4-dienoyl-CoA reductase/sulfur reductase-like enzyme
VVRTLEDAVALRAELTRSARLVVIGAGFIGCEVAATARGLGCAVDVVAPEQVPMQRPLGPELGAAMQRRHERHGVRFHLGRLPKELLSSPDDAGRIGGLLLDDGRRLDADVVVEALGCLPNTEWLAEQRPGHRLDLSDGVLTDGWMRARSTDAGTLPEVVAAGDLARFPNARYDDVPRRVEHWSIPTDTGKRAGQALAAALTGADLADTPAFAPMPSFWSDQYGERLQSFGALGLADEVRVLQGDPDAEFVAEYLRAGTRVGVLGVGLMPTLLALRTELMNVTS